MISFAPLVMAVKISSPCSMWRLMFSIVTVASSTRMPTASARPPSVMTLMVWPSRESAVNELKTASGIETVMMRVDRQLPRKTKNHESCERRRDQSLPHDGGDGRFDEVGLVRNELEVDAGRKRGFDCGEASLDARDDVERGRRADLENGHQNALAPVELDDIGLRRRTVVDVGDVAHEHDGAVDHLDRQIVEVRDRLRRIIEIDGEFVGADFLRADRIDLVLQGERRANVRG